eukprot:COSAG05_NODE_5964_length_1050_cov_1.019979_2_plen_253_part_01
MPEFCTISCANKRNTPENCLLLWACMNSLLPVFIDALPRYKCQAGIICSRPGAPAGKWHTDGGHSKFKLFDGESGGPSAVCVFVPLVDLTAPALYSPLPPSASAGCAGPGHTAIAAAAASIATGNTEENGNSRLLGSSDRPRTDHDHGGSAGGSTHYAAAAAAQEAQELSGGGGGGGVGVRHGLGCTAFWPGSHRHPEAVHLGSAAARMGACVSGAPMRAGDVLLYLPSSRANRALFPFTLRGSISGFATAYS